MLLLLLFGMCLLVGAGAIVISIIGAIVSLFVKSDTTEKTSDSSLNVVTQEKTASQQQQILSKENSIVGTSSDT